MGALLFMLLAVLVGILLARELWINPRDARIDLPEEGPEPLPALKKAPSKIPTKAPQSQRLSMSSQGACGSLKSKPSQPSIHDPFDTAWMGLLAEIEGDSEPLLRFYQRHVSEMHQNPYKTGVALSVEVPASVWRWPAYTTQVEVPLKEQSEEHKETIRLASPREVLEFANLSELRAAVDGKTKARSKDVLIERILSVLADDEMAKVVDKLRIVLLQQEDASPNENYRDRCLHFVRRWSALGYRAQTVANFRESAQVVSGMTARILPSGGYREPCECERLASGSFPMESPILMQYAPCSQLDCGCSWTPIVPGWKSMVQS